MTQPIRRVLIQEKRANGKGLLRGLTLAAFAALGTLTCVASAGAATLIDSCRTLDTVGGSYVLADNLDSCDTCLVVANDRITIDLAGHTITGSCAFGAGITAGITDVTDRVGTRRQGTTVKNGTITGFTAGVFLLASTRNTIRDLTSSGNSVLGIWVGDHSLVKGCATEDNGLFGIIIGEFGQVQDSTVTGHEDVGIFGEGHLLVRDNTVKNNNQGIVVGDFSNVSFNTSSGNTLDGLLAGNHSLVTRNTTDGNGNAGIATEGLSTVSSNTSSGNGGGGIDVKVGAVSDGTRNLVTGNTTNGNGLVGVTAMCPGTVTNNKSSGNGSGIWDNYDIGLGCRTNNNQ
jgi:hypothetical protein